MKKSIIVLLIAIPLILSCKTNHSINSQQTIMENDYIPYYLKVYEAKEKYDSKSYEESLSILDSLFQKYEPIEIPTIYEMDIYCELSVLLKKYDRNTLKKVLSTSVSKYGRKPYMVEENDSYWKAAVFHSGLEKKDFDNLNSKYLSGINYGLKDTIVEMYKRDQMFRKKDNNYNPSKFDSIDKINGNLLLNILKKYGLPRENLVGGMEQSNPVKPSYLSTVLMHLDYEFYKTELKPLLYKELQNGNLSPLDFATMNDKFFISHKDKIMDYPYFGTFRNGRIQDTLKTNEARKQIGLPKIK